MKNVSIFAAKYNVCEMITLFLMMPNDFLLDFRVKNKNIFNIKYLVVSGIFLEREREREREREYRLVCAPAGAQYKISSLNNNGGSVFFLKTAPFFYGASHRCRKLSEAIRKGVPFLLHILPERFFCLRKTDGHFF